MASIKSRDKTTGYEKDDFFEKGLLTVSVCEDYKPTHWRGRRRCWRRSLSF